MIPFYAGGILIASLFNRKARLLIKGHKQIFKTLKDQIDPEASFGSMPHR